MPIYVALRSLIYAALLVLFGFASLAQTTIATGSIQGTLTDPSGAAVASAHIRVTNKGTGQILNLTSNSDGLYHSGGLVPGEYNVRVEVTGFSSAELNITV